MLTSDSSDPAAKAASTDSVGSTHSDPRTYSDSASRRIISSLPHTNAVLALALLLVVGANTNNLVPFYAIGVFTGFAMVGFGMARYHRKTKEPGWRRRLIINLRPRRVHRAGGGDLRRREVHRGRLAGGGGVSGHGVPAHPAQPAIPQGSWPTSCCGS